MSEDNDFDFDNIDDIDDLDLTEEYPSEHELDEDHEALAGEEVDDSWLDSDGDGIPDYLDDEDGNN